MASITWMLIFLTHVHFGHCDESTVQLECARSIPMSLKSPRCSAVGLLLHPNYLLPLRKSATTPLKLPQKLEQLRKLNSIFKHAAPSRVYPRPIRHLGDRQRCQNAWYTEIRNENEYALGSVHLFVWTAICLQAHSRPARSLWKSLAWEPEFLPQ